VFTKRKMELARDVSLKVGTIRLKPASIMLIVFKIHVCVRSVLYAVSQ
jgi:hypothetical protein